MEKSNDVLSKKSNNTLEMPGKLHKHMKIIGKLFGDLGWNKKLSELNEEEVLFMIMVIQGMELVNNDKFNETYLAAIWLKHELKYKSDFSLSGFQRGF
tara:strand:- start:26 stop:319 length:294 start_codon:yes stop_codon:yes gene_type:complete